MTREEAVEELYRIIENQYRSAEKDKEALGMAIEALEKEPCEDAVSRKAMLKYQEYLHGKMPNEENYKLWEFIKDLPSVTPKQKTGKWIKHDTGHSIYYDCSLCGCTAPHIEVADKILWKLSNYCPDCGAKMEVEEYIEDVVEWRRVPE